jgi:NUMOD4 motif/HNH endonuclease
MSAPEVWLPVVGYEGWYEVSDQGRVRSLTRRARVLKAYPNNQGYLRVNLSKGGHVKAMYAHLLVLAAFKGPCPPEHEGCHGPGGRSDNRVVNLDWGSKSKNNGADKVRDGTMQRGERNGRSKLTEDDVRLIRLELDASVSGRSLSRRYGVSPQMIREIQRKKIWAWVK